jgi:heterodisulfide reductase subunit A-like polyferredoxin
MNVHRRVFIKNGLKVAVVGMTSLIGTSDVIAAVCNSSCESSSGLREPCYQIICDQCINCGICEDVCEVQAIDPGEDCPHIDLDRCKCCGTCFRSCPVGAIGTLV